jgi:hypothetical protein
MYTQSLYSTLTSFPVSTTPERQFSRQNSQLESADQLTFVLVSRHNRFLEDERVVLDERNVLTNTIVDVLELESCESVDGSKVLVLNPLLDKALELRRGESEHSTIADSYDRVSFDRGREGGERLTYGE